MIFSICDFVYPPVILPLKFWDIEFDEKHQTEEVGEFPQQKYLVYSKNYIKNESCYMYRAECCRSPYHITLYIYIHMYIPTE